MKPMVSKWAAMGYRMALSGDKIVLVFVGEGNPDPAVKDLIPELTAHKAELLEYLQRTDKHDQTADELRQAIQTAQTTGDLERLHDELTDLWDRGQVDHATAETLTRLMWERDRQFYQTEQRQVQHAT